MTAPIDPRIEAVAKLLFTGPLLRMDAEYWDEAVAEKWGNANVCLKAAGDVLRGIDEAAVWEYGVSYSQRSIRGYVDGWTGWMFSDRDKAVKCASEYLDGSVLRRRAAGQSEPLP